MIWDEELMLTRNEPAFDYTSLHEEVIAESEEEFVRQNNLVACINRAGLSERRWLSSSSTTSSRTRLDALRMRTSSTRTSSASLRRYSLIVSNGYASIY